MKTTLCILACFLSVSAMGRADLSSGLADARNLAHGYATAFQAMDKSPVTITYLSQGQTETIKDVSQITSFDGVLLIRAYGGSKQILDAGRVIKISGD